MLLPVSWELAYGSTENRSAGSVMRYQLAPYCNEQRFIFERWRNR
jgi:hypothetical protein